MSPQPLENLLPQKDVTRVQSLGNAYSIIMLIKKVPGSFHVMLVSFMSSRGISFLKENKLHLLTVTWFLSQGPAPVFYPCPFLQTMS